MSVIAIEAPASFLLEQEAALAGELTDVVVPVGPAPEAPAISWRQRAAAVLALSSALAGTACEAPGTHATWHAPTASASPDSTPEAEKGGPEQPTQRFVVYPITLKADGFAPAVYPEGMLEQRVRDGWLDLSVATGGVATSNVTVTVQPTRELTVPGVTSVPDFCKKDRDDGFEGKVQEAVKEAESIKDLDHTEGLVRTTSIIVVEQSKAPACYIAMAGPGYGMFVYDGKDMVRAAYTHEDGHLVGWGHDKVVSCGMPVRRVISSSCEVAEYGSRHTVMGGSYNSTEPDPFSGFALERIGAISPEEVYTVDPDGRKHQVELNALNNGYGGAKLIYIPMQGLEGKKQLDALKCANGFYLELSGADYPVNNGQGLYLPVTLKAYVVNSREGLPATYQLPFYEYSKYNDEYFRQFDLTDYAAHNPSSAYIQVGDTLVEVKLNSIEQGNSKRDATGTAVVTVNATKVKIPASARVPDCSNKG